MKSFLISYRVETFYSPFHASLRDRVFKQKKIKKLIYANNAISTKYVNLIWNILASVNFKTRVYARTNIYFMTKEKNIIYK